MIRAAAKSFVIGRQLEARLNQLKMAPPAAFRLKEAPIRLTRFTILGGTGMMLQRVNYRLGNLKSRLSSCIRCTADSLRRQSIPFSVRAI